MSEHEFCWVDLSCLGEFSSSLREEVDSLKGGGKDRNLSFVNMGQNEGVNGIKKRMRLDGDVKKSHAEEAFAYTTILIILILVRRSEAKLQRRVKL